MVAKKKLTKRQILNELLNVREKQYTVQASQERLWKREERLQNQYEKLSIQLESLCLTEQENAGDSSFKVKEPIVYKGHVFTLETTKAYGETALSIKPINIVR